MSLNLMPHQIEDAALLALGDDLPNFSEAGSGKTHTTLEAIKLAKFQTGLIVAPAIALPMWKEEIESYLGASAHILKTGASPLRGTADFHIISYGLTVPLAMRSRLMALGGDVMVLDESHYVKNSMSKRCKAVFGPATAGNGGLFAAYSQCWELTGTPIMRHADDLWSQLRAGHGEVLRAYDVDTLEKFVRTFCFTQMRQYHPRAPMKRAVVGSTNTQLLNKLLYEDIGAIRRTMDEVGGDMPPLTYREIAVPLDGGSELANLLKGLTQEEILLRLGKDDIMAKAWRLLGELKVHGAVDYIEEVARQHPVLVGYWHTDTGDEVQRILAEMGFNTARVQGSTPMDKREEIRKSFNGGGIDVLVGQISAMNTAWNLQKCGNHVVILEDHFSPGLIEQFVKRVWRFGQENHVQCDFIKSVSPLDKAITKSRSRKNKAAAQILGDVT